MKMKDAGTELSAPHELTTAKKSYPRLTLDLDSFPELNEVGKKATLVIEVCVTGVRSDDYGSTVDVEVEECGVKGMEKNAADEELEKITKHNLSY